jgi:hypothetical protein
VTGDTGGGVQPRWRRDGRELYFLARDGRLMAAAVSERGGALAIGAPRALFQTSITTEGGLGTRADYDVTRDGQKVVVAQARADSVGDSSPITLFLNWRSKLAR